MTESFEKIVSQFMSDYQLAEVYRRPVELQWLEDLRQFKGIYDPDVMSCLVDNRSKVYPKYTRSKVIPAIAKLNYMLFPDSERNWAIKPTPRPRVSDDVLSKIVHDLSQRGHQLSVDVVEMAVKEYVQTACDKMETVIDDQLTELKYNSICKDVIRDGVRYGTGIIKGPLSITKRRLSIVSDVRGGFRQVDSVVYMPFFEHVPIWHVYPDMTATSFNDCRYIFQRHRMSKADLLRLTQRSDFIGDNIISVLRSKPGGDYILKYWELEHKALSDTTSAVTHNVYDVTEAWGYIDIHDLPAVDGVPYFDSDAVGEVFVNCWIVANKVIKIAFDPLPGNVLPYHVFYFDKDETSVFGTGLVRIIRDTQMIHCASWRSMLDNASTVSGPQVEVNMDRLVEGQRMDEFYPGKMWFTKDSLQNIPALRSLDFPSHTQEYLSIIQAAEQIGDKESNLPSSLFGDIERNPNETARGVSTRTGNMNLVIDDIVGHFDECNKGVLSAIYAWNMEFNPDPDINGHFDECNKGVLSAIYAWNMEFNPDPDINGDFEVSPRGSSSLMTKELKGQSLMSFISVVRSDPALSPYVKAREFLEDFMRSVELDPGRLLKSEDELRLELQQQQQSAGGLEEVV